MPTILFLTSGRKIREIGDRIAREGRAVWRDPDTLEVSRSEFHGDPRAVGGVEPEPAETCYRFLFRSSVANVIAEAAKTPIDLLMVDNRPDGLKPYRSFAASPAGRLLPLLSSSPRDHRGVTRRQIVLLVASGETLARDLYVAGATKLGGYLVDPLQDPPEGAPPTASFLDQIALLLGTRRPGKLGLCLAGGGIEGLIYELGVLRALDDFMVGTRITDFDVFCGISAGAVIAAFLANGVSPRELTDGMRDGTPLVAPIGRKVLFQPNAFEIVDRLWGFARELVRRREEPGKRRRDPWSLLMRFLPGGFFSGEPLKWYLEEEFTRPGRTNSFRQLRKELYLGATDQDSGRPVVFGEAGFRDVPISHAVRASTALVPYYPPEVINGRFMVDGAFTRTTNFPVAIRHGARLVLIVNPFVPLVTGRAGAVDGQGGVFAALQGLKSLVHSRFEQVYAHIEDNYPDVDFEVFLPEGDELEQVSGTLMKFFYRIDLADLAYEQTAAKIRRRMPGIADALARHGLLLRDPASEAPLRLSGPDPFAETRVPEVAAGAS